MYDVLGKGAGRVRTIGDVYEWDQTRSQGLVIEVEHPRLGRLELPGPPVRFDEATVQAHRAPPALGEHTEEVLQWLRSG